LRGFVKEQYHMNVIGHNYKFIHRDTGHPIAGYNIFLNNRSGICQPDVRGVDGAAPYDP
jgi:hypothetical protein